MIVQIYSIKNVSEAEDCIKAGVDYIGIAAGNEMGLPAEIDLEKGKEIFEAIGERAVKVGLTTLDTEEEILVQVEALKPDILHVCGDNYYLTESFVKKLKADYPKMQVMQAIGVMNGKKDECVAQAVKYGAYCDYLILDTVAPDVIGIGAVGKTHDFNIDAAIVEAVDCKVIIAGGLSPENVEEAILIAKPFGVDSLTKTNKFLESGERTKDYEAMKAFVENAHAAAKKL